MPVWTVDHHGGDAALRIEEGDYCRTAKTVYQVVSIRPVDSKVWPDRWKIEVVRVMSASDWENAEVPALFPRVWQFGAPYARGTGPADYPCGLDTCEGCGNNGGLTTVTSGA